MNVNAPMAWFRTAVSDKTEVEAGFVLDGTSGASPIYHDTLSGASGKGIHDRRRAEDVSVTHTFEDFSLTAGFSTSTDHDYDSLGGSLETRIWTSDHNTVFNFGFSGSSDDVSSTNDLTLDRHKAAQGAGFGITQILDQNSVLQSNITFSGSHGYQSDPYKTLDLRPRVRDEVAWLTRYNHYFSSVDGSIHLDYRYFQDTWGISAHTAELGWSQALGQSWLLTPYVRFYSQNKAEFYSNAFPPESPGTTFFTADERLSGFGSITTGLGVSHELMPSVTLSGNLDYMQQRGDWKIGSPGSPGLEAMNALIFGVGVHLKF